MSRAVGSKDRNEKGGYVPGAGNRILGWKSAKLELDFTLLKSFIEIGEAWKYEM